MSRYETKWKERNKIMKNRKCGGNKGEMGKKSDFGVFAYIGDNTD